KAFQALKNHLITSPVLRHPDFSRPFYLHTNTSILGLGAVLVRLDKDNKEYVIAYASRSINRAEQNYSISELEYLAIMWVVEYFHQYLELKPFFLITDHSSL
ncbi:20041_t:CDS:1, partial [Racocetra persica]